MHAHAHSWFISLIAILCTATTCTLENVKHNGYFFFLFSISNLPMCPKFSFVIALTVRNNFRVPIDSLVNTKSHFNRCCPGRRRGDVNQTETVYCPVIL